MGWRDPLDEIKTKDWSKASAVEREKKAKEVIDACSYAGSLTSLVPVPMVDLALLLPVHTVMVMTVGHVYGRTITQAEASRIALELGAVAGVSFAGTVAISALKRLLLPGLGGVLSIPATFALTWGLGHVAMAYFADPHLSRDQLKKVFLDALKEGKSTFSKETFERFKKGDAPKPPPPKAEPDSAPPDPSLRQKRRQL